MTENIKIQSLTESQNFYRRSDTRSQVVAQVSCRQKKITIFSRQKLSHSACEPTPMSKDPCRHYAQAKANLHCSSFDRTYRKQSDTMAHCRFHMFERYPHYKDDLSHNKLCPPGRSGLIGIHRHWGQVQRFVPVTYTRQISSSRRARWGFGHLPLKLAAQRKRTEPEPTRTLSSSVTLQTEFKLMNYRSDCHEHKPCVSGHISKIPS
jgi:hypothetical protein